MFLSPLNSKYISFTNSENIRNKHIYIEIKLWRIYLRSVRFWGSFLLFLVRVKSVWWWWDGDSFDKLCPTLATPWTVAHQAPLSMGFSRQEYWSGLLFPSPRDIPDPEIEPRSPALQADSCIAGRFFTDWATTELNQYANSQIIPCV